jgi:hypothetical protein
VKTRAGVAFSKTGTDPVSLIMKVMYQPDYQGGSLVNLITSLSLALGGESQGYAPLRGLDAEHLQRYRTIVLLVVDGLGYHYLTRAGAGATLRSHLLERITSVFPTTTATAITTFYTGLAPQQHGLPGWHTWFRELGCVLRVLPTRPRYGGVPLGAAQIDVQRLFDHPAVFDHLQAQSHVIAPQFITDSDFNLAHRGQARLAACETLEQVFAQIARIAHGTGERRYLYAYWPELDRLAHERGIGSEAAHEHLAELDAGFAHLLDQLAGSETLVIVTADHGIIDTAPEHLINLDDHPQLADMLVLPLCGEPRVAYCYVRPERCRDFERCVRQEFAPVCDLWPSRELIAQGLFGPGEPHPRLSERVGDYTLIMKQNFVIKDWLFGEHRYTQVGVHGGLSEQELYVPLIVAAC